MSKGIIFDKKEFAIFDGPGIRQTIFLKGCPLRCSWCHNPEGLSIKPQLMVSTVSCIQCGRCREKCPEKETGKACNCCGACIPVCPLNLRRICGEEIEAQDLIRQIIKSNAYYAAYGGGVTFSGGEPFMQAGFLLEVLRGLPDVHCAIETSGYCSEETFLEVLSHLDYVIMDIKLFDSKLHKKYTGVDNTGILKNARLLCESEIPFVIRIPVIPGVNDNEENYRNTAGWIAQAKTLVKVELLPYHKMAGAKYGMIAETYKPQFDTEKKGWVCPEIFEEYGIQCEIL